MGCANSSSTDVKVINNKCPCTAIDSTTSVPDDLFVSLMIAGKQARNRGVHVEVKGKGGVRRLQHSNPDVRPEAEALSGQCCADGDLENQDGIHVGAELEALDRIKISSNPDFWVDTGDAGIVVGVDKVGDLKVVWAKYASAQAWLVRKNLSRVRVKESSSVDSSKIIVEDVDSCDGTKINLAEGAFDQIIPGKQFAHFI